jgi:hypothetical protein
MRLILGTLSLLVVLAVIGIVGRKQLDALGLRSGTEAPAAATVPAQSAAIQNKARDAAAAALQQGAQRASEASQ